MRKCTKDIYYCDNSFQIAYGSGMNYCNSRNCSAVEQPADITSSDHQISV